MTNFQQHAITILPKGKDSMGESIQQFKKSGQATLNQQLACSNLNKHVVLSLVFYLQSGVKRSLSAHLIYRELTYWSTELCHIIH